MTTEQSFLSSGLWLKHGIRTTAAAAAAEEEENGGTTVEYLPCRVTWTGIGPTGGLYPSDMVTWKVTKLRHSAPRSFFARMEPVVPSAQSALDLSTLFFPHRISVHSFFTSDLSTLFFFSTMDLSVLFFSHRISVNSIFTLHLSMFLFFIFTLDPRTVIFHFGFIIGYTTADYS